MAEASAFARSSSPEDGPLTRALASLPFQVAVETHWKLLNAMDHFNTYGDAQPFKDIALEVLLTASLERNEAFRAAVAECANGAWTEQLPDREAVAPDVVAHD